MAKKQEPFPYWLFAGVGIIALWSLLRKPKTPVVIQQPTYAQSYKLPSQTVEEKLLQAQREQAGLSRTELGARIVYKGGTPYIQYPDGTSIPLLSVTGPLVAAGVI